MTIADLFDLSLVGRRDAIALEYEGRAHSFGDMDDRSNRVAQLLLQRGFHIGDRLCVYLANSIELREVFFVGTAAEVLPITEIDFYALKAPGAVTKRVQSAYDDLVRGGEPAPADWHTPVYSTVPA